MKKYLLPLILILFLTFASIGNCWVAGYDQRIKLTIDHTKIDGALSNFPVTAFFTGAQAEEVFAEFDADEDFDRGQFALSDDTLLKAEKELFDDSASSGIYHFKVPSVSSSAGTDIYFYYDNDADHNTSYIGIIGSATAAEVWVGYKFVCHMVDDTTSTVLDSTSNNKDGTKASASNPAEVTGKISKAQSFTNDYITTALPTAAITNVTLEAVVNFTDNTMKGCIIKVGKYAADPDGYSLGVGTSNFDDPEGNDLIGLCDWVAWMDFNKTIGTGWHHIAMTRDATTWRGYVDGVVSATTFTDTPNTPTTELNIGRNEANEIRYFNDIIDESRVSDTTVRSAAWLKATYNSLFDTLLTYGSEETSANAIFFGMNF